METFDPNDLAQGGVAVWFPRFDAGLDARLSEFPVENEPIDPITG